MTRTRTRAIIYLLTPIFLLLFTVEKSAAQYYYYDNNYYDNKVTFELGASVAAMNCLTDIGGNQGIGKPFVKDLNYGNTKLGGSVYFSATYKYAVGLRLEATFGQIGAYDSILKNVASTTEGRYERNLSFRSNISEIALIAEFHPLFIFVDWESKDKQPPTFSPYIMGGIGLFSFNPQALLNGRWVDLQPLHTEGEGWVAGRNEYKLQQMNIPVGIGFRYEVNSLLNVRAECLVRILNTDYLDDVSTRYIPTALFYQHLQGQQLTDALLLNNRNLNINPKYISRPGSLRGKYYNNDSYFTFNLKLGLIMGREKVR
ncbi:DUF6089 family protein [Ferruginibacter albus]|uniref:DUF6089 family protein n=1 Tax=Ferruginibacter albus TaxID=2875540 RepID=UPI001CC531C0|nr:DUF6089 family protein [Ferruginibacter albus]UAY52377.1 DUF6089 family protein [Ferruginibacter albus]